jgi:hypothetical protein
MVWLLTRVQQNLAPSRFRAVQRQCRSRIVAGPGTCPVRVIAPTLTPDAPSTFPPSTSHQPRLLLLSPLPPRVLRSPPPPPAATTHEPIWFSSSEPPLLFLVRRSMQRPLLDGHAQPPATGEKGGSILFLHLLLHRIQQGRSEGRWIGGGAGWI